MKKKLLFVAVCVASVVVGYVSYDTQKRQREKMSYLTMANVEALGSIEDWWHRKDYDCVKVRCTCIGYNYESKVGSFVGKGKGSVAHIWDCAGCGDCGWEVI